MGSFAAVRGFPLIPAKHASNAGNTGDFIAQYPLFANTYFAAPLAVFPQILVYHGEEFLHRRCFVRVRELGATLTKNNPKEILGDWRVYITAVMRLIVIPLAIYYIGRIFITDKMFLNTLVVGAAIPTASFCALFAKEFGGDDVLASKYIFISTLLCLVTIPLVYIIII